MKNIIVTESDIREAFGKAEDIPLEYIINQIHSVSFYAY